MQLVKDRRGEPQVRPLGRSTHHVFPLRRGREGLPVAVGRAGADRWRARSVMSLAIQQEAVRAIGKAERIGRVAPLGDVGGAGGQRGPVERLDRDGGVGIRVFLVAQEVQRLRGVPRAVRSMPGCGRAAAARSRPRGAGASGRRGSRPPSRSSGRPASVSGYASIRRAAAWRRDERNGGIEDERLGDLGREVAGVRRRVTASACWRTRAASRP